MTLKAECQARITNLQQRLAEAQLDGALFIYPIDIYYFAATRQNSALWIPTDGRPVLMVRKSLSRAKTEACIEDIRPFPRSREFPALFEGIQNIGMPLDVMPVQQYRYFEKLLPKRNFEDISTGYREQRSVKSPWELEKMRASGRRLCSVFAQIPEFLRPGMREVDLAAEFEARLRRAGGEGYVRMRAYNQELFMGLAVAGDRAATTGFFDGAVTGPGLSTPSPHGPSSTPIAPGEPILVDYTGVFDGYLVDMTRMFVCGELDDQLRHAFEVALAIQERIRSNLKPGAIASQLFATALEMADEAGLAEFFMGVPGENARFVGHGVGLELDELPVLAQGFDLPLIAGQTVAVEPKFVFPGKGAIGIENTYAVTETGGEKITDMPDDLVKIGEAPERQPRTSL